MIWRLLFFSQLREQPIRLSITVLAIALGVALGTAVYLVNAAALNEFGLATKQLVGESDVIVRGPREGFAEKLFATLARNPKVAVASPALELDVALAGRGESLKVLAIDPFRAAALQPALMAEIGDGVFPLLQSNGIYLSHSAAQRLGLKPGDVLEATVGSSARALPIVGVLSGAAYSQDLALMDIAAAQWLFDRLGLLNRIDLRLVPGTDVEGFRRELAGELPVGVAPIAPQLERDRAVSVTRAYRVNLNMLALVALFTGAFLVFSTQSLSVLRRRRSLALLRALGVTRGQLQRALLGEGIALGVLGSCLGLAFGALIAALILRFLSGDLGNGQLHVAGATLRASPFAVLAFFVIGIAVSGFGAWVPARNAAHQAPARALKGGDADIAPATRLGWRIGLMVAMAGALLAWLPAIHGIPVFGYGAIGLLLLGAVLLVPAITVAALRWAPLTRRVVIDTAVAQLRENVGLSALSLASIIVSFSLMVAMAIMVYSFRESFDQWLGKLLPADLQMREPYGNDTAFWSADDQVQIAKIKGIARVQFRRIRPLLLDPARPPVTLLVRADDASQTAAELPLVRSAPLASDSGIDVAWISEAAQDLYGYRVGDTITLPLAGTNHFFKIAGIWRDYARTTGSVVISRAAYVAATGDHTANEASLWLEPGANPDATTVLLRQRSTRGDALEVTTTTAIHERSLKIFDRAFAVTYALEVIAVLIGLAGISFAASSTALARRAEFGVLRHIGMLRRQVIELLASEGILTSLFGVLYGLLLGFMLSLVLVYVVNRQSFNWSIDLAIPGWQLLALSLLLVAAAALTAILSGRAATGFSAVQAVREDW
jgi:putative ABC transport system permease protein